MAVPRASDERTHVRRRHRRRRDQHVVLRRPVALQLPEQPGGLTGSASRAAGDHRGHEPGVGLRPLEERDACRLTRQQPRGPRASATRSHQPGLSARHQLHQDNRQRHVRRPAGRRPARPRYLGPRSEHNEIRLLELRRRADFALGAGRLVPRRVRHADVPDQRQPDPVDVSASHPPGGRARRCKR